MTTRSPTRHLLPGLDHGLCRVGRVEEDGLVVLFAQPVAAHDALDLGDVGDRGDALREIEEGADALGASARGRSGRGPR